MKLAAECHFTPIADSIEMTISHIRHIIRQINYIFIGTDTKRIEIYKNHVGISVTFLFTVLCIHLSNKTNGTFWRFKCLSIDLEAFFRYN
jgi:hypothetical protein